MSLEKDKKFVCSECNSVYFYNRNLRKHVRKAHPDKISDDIAPTQNSKKTFKYKCHICGKQYNQSYNLKLHERKIHNLDTREVFNCRRIDKLKCPLCAEIYPLKKKLFDHIECGHNMHIEVQNLQLQSFDEFIKWKEKIEDETVSKYIKEHGSKKDSGNIRHYFVCHRSGHYNPEVKRQRKLKSQGSQKINGICPASLLVHEAEDGVCKIRFISTHVGHNCDIDHLHLTASEREDLATDIANNVPFQTIIEKARSRITDSRQSRINRLKKKDLYNIQRKLSSPGSSSNLETVVKELSDQENSSVLFYKLPNTVNETYPKLNLSDFVLIVMNEWQCTLLKRHADNFICVDKLSKPNFNGFELVVITTIDVNRQVYPCAFLITNRCDQSIFSMFFYYIQLKVGKISASVFMSTVDECAFNAWVTTMEEPKMKHYCTWHVQDEWDRNRSKIVNVEKQTEVINALKELMFDHDSDGFEIKLRILIQQLLEDQETVEFGKYMSEYFLKNISCWALCYRYKYIIEINSNLERVHMTLEHLFVSGNNYKRLDLSICSITSYVFKMLLNDFISVQDNEVAFLSNDIQSRHEASRKLLSDSLIGETEDGWSVQSGVDSQEIFLIKPCTSNCNCKLMCSECDVCIHKYVCTCPESYLEWNMCQHIHLICSYLNSHQNHDSVKLFIADDTFSIPFESEVVISESGEILVHINEEHCSEVNDSININSEVRSVKECEKEQVKQTFTELIDSVTNDNQLDIVKKSLCTLKTLLSATQMQTMCLSSSTLTGKDDSIENSNHVHTISESNILQKKCR